MQPGQPSLTALGAATHRAAHQVLENGRIFNDPLALSIIGRTAEDVAREAAEHSRGLRLFIAARTRFAEDALAASGASQLVVLGAGLDTYAYRTTLKLRVFEVDHPATQAWKRERLAAAGIAIPQSLTFAPVDFESETLAGGLARAGFDENQRTFFTWLGVTPYLTEQAIFATLGFIAGVKAQVAFDYANPPQSIADSESRALQEALAARVAAAGESFKTYFDSDELRLRLKALGFDDVEDLGPSQIAARYFQRPGGTRDKGGHLLRAAVR
jgi:methyltransferase (TIGR00027 family)